METPRLRWTRGRTIEAAGETRILEWIGWDNQGQPIARVVLAQGPVQTDWRSYRAVALDRDGRLIELRPKPPEGEGWLACVGGQVVGRAAWPLQAVRTAEAALAG
jgi:hypothetical protein